MILGRSVIGLIFALFIAVCLFILVQWGLPALFALVGFTVPPKIATVVALIVAAGFVYSGWWGYNGWRGAP